MCDGTSWKVTWHLLIKSPARNRADTRLSSPLPYSDSYDAHHLAAEHGTEVDFAFASANAGRKL
jgi:hypothetical protein